MCVLKCRHPRRHVALPVKANLKTKSCQINAVPRWREIANVLRENQIRSLGYMFKHTHTHTHTRTNTHAHARTQTTRAHTNTNAHTRAHARTHARIHASTHTLTHTTRARAHTHARVRARTHCKSLHGRKRSISCLNRNRLHKPSSAYSCTESYLIGCVKIPLQAVYQEGWILDGLNTDRQTDTGKQPPVWVFVLSVHQRPFLIFNDNKHRTLWNWAGTVFICTAGFKEKIGHEHCSFCTAGFKEKIGHEHCSFCIAGFKEKISHSPI